MQKIRFVFEMFVGVLIYLWKEQRDIFLIWGLFCIAAMAAGVIELSLGLFCAGVAGVFLMVALGYFLAYFGDDE